MHSSSADRLKTQEKNPGDEADEVRPASKFQFSLGFMMLLTLVMAMMGGGMMYASFVPAVQEEISVLTGAELDEIAVSEGRSAHIAFIMFTFTSPLLLAGALATALGVFRWLVRSGRIRREVIREEVIPAELDGSVEA